MRIQRGAWGADLHRDHRIAVNGGNEVVGDLQKSGVYHAADVTTMKPVWSTLVGASCAACNATSTTFDGSSIEGEATPGGTMFSLAHTSGATQWLTPVGDVVHYQPVGSADSVVWSIDTTTNLDAFDAATGQMLARRPMSSDAGAPVTNDTSAGVAIAEHKLFVAAGGAGYSSATGYVIAYQASWPHERHHRFPGPGLDRHHRVRARSPPATRSAEVRAAQAPTAGTVRSRPIQELDSS